jgi:hypothetical protein
MTKPEYVKPHQVPFYYPVCRSQVYTLEKLGLIKTKSLRLPGNVRGTKLVLLESVRQYIESCPSK